METRRHVPKEGSRLVGKVGALSSLEAPCGAEGARIRGKTSDKRQEQKPKEMTSPHSTEGTKLPPPLCKVASVWSRSL